MTTSTNGTKLTKQQRRELEYILQQLRQARAYIMKPDIAVAGKRQGDATTTLHYIRPSDGMTLYEFNKEIGSDLACLHTAVNLLDRFLHPPMVTGQFAGVEFVDGDAKLAQQ